MWTSAQILPSATPLGVRTERRGIDFPDPHLRRGRVVTIETELERVLLVLLLTRGHAVVSCVMLGPNPEFYIKPDPSDQATNLFGSVDQGCGSA